MDWHERIRQLELILANEEHQVHDDEYIPVGESMVPHDEENLLQIEANEDIQNEEHQDDGEDLPYYSDSEDGDDLPYYSDSEGPYPVVYTLDVTFDCKVME